jgi:uncharacterized protein (DUF305 family)
MEISMHSLNRPSSLVVALALASIVAIAPAALAGAMTAADTANPADKAFAQSMRTMMKGMMVAPTGKPDHDFVLMMMPHHQGAIDMAKVELQYGKDPELMKLADDIVAAQEKEIAQMKAWLEKNR